MSDDVLYLNDGAIFEMGDGMVSEMRICVEETNMGYDTDILASLATRTVNSDEDTNAVWMTEDMVVATILFLEKVLSNYRSEKEKKGEKKENA